MNSLSFAHPLNLSHHSLIPQVFRMERAAHTHWSGNVNIDEIFATGCTESCQMTTFSATSDENSIKMTIFPLQCKVYRALIAVSELTCEPAVVTVQLYIARVTAPGVFGVLLLRLDLTASSLPSLLSPLSRFLREIPRPNKNKGSYRQHVLLSGNSPCLLLPSCSYCPIIYCQSHSLRHFWDASFVTVSGLLGVVAEM